MLLWRSVFEVVASVLDQKLKEEVGDVFQDTLHLLKNPSLTLRRSSFPPDVHQLCELGLVEPV